MLASLIAKRVSLPILKEPCNRQSGESGMKGQTQHIPWKETLAIHGFPFQKLEAFPKQGLEVL